ncbi:hypothetical protein OpiT1DRAFT_03967 [Opitutaceae bacterium TAV1]|nr:hypothetical protein OpiT1DRAFT_03967 [Opitutaceae bacterium TAV1]
MIDKNTLHSTTAEIVGTVQLLFAEGAATRAEALAKGFTDLGNFLGMETKGEAAKVPVQKAYRGKLRESRNIPGLMKQGYDLRTCEIADARKLKFGLMGTPLGNFAQPALADVAIDPLDFSPAEPPAQARPPAVLHTWYPLLRNGVQVRELTAVTIPDMTEDVDFMVDKKAGIIRFINAATLPSVVITPTVSAPLINGASPNGLVRLKPMTKASWSGYFRLYVWDQDDRQCLAMAHEDFSGEISPSSPFNVAGDALSEMKILVSVGDDVGEVLHRNG